MSSDAGLYNAFWLADHYSWPIGVVLEMTLQEVNGHFAFLNERERRKRDG